MLNLGIPDEFIGSAKPVEQKAQCGLTEDAVLAAIDKRLKLSEKENAQIISDMSAIKLKLTNVKPA